MVIKNFWGSKVKKKCWRAKPN